MTSSISRLVRNALDEIAEKSLQASDGKWLEHLTVQCAVVIREWDVDEAWPWNSDWPDREKHYPNRTDIGIDVVARRASDGALIAIQCKSRQLDENGRGADITKSELNSFLATSDASLWAERWLVTNGDVHLARDALSALGPNPKPVKVVNFQSDLLKQWEAEASRYSDQDNDDGVQTKDSMQREAIETSVGILKKHASINDRRARGRIILPCATGKSRIALRIIEELTEPGQSSAVLCPSIALVAQLRREFLINSEKPIKAMAVCSDATAGRGSDLSRDQTADIGSAAASEVKGLVTTDSEEIRKWIEDVAREQDRIGVIFGTYQSSHRIADALEAGSREIQVMIADEAHRTAGLRRMRGWEERLRDFTVCHDDRRFPARFRVYQTATPRVYDTGGKSRGNDDWVVRNMDDAEVFGVELYRRSYADAVANEWLTDYRILALGVNDEDAYRTANSLAASHGKLSTTQFMRGLVLALVMSGGVRPDDEAIRSSISFMNTIQASKGMTEALQSETVRNWVQRRLEENGTDSKVTRFKLQHLDAASNVTAREMAKARLADATDNEPYGIINVGIFGEGTDAPSLSAVGFLEARKSPVDVIQAVGRVMRRAPDKKMGYIICPILIPPHTDAETWLRNSGPDDGWRELGQILLALRAHDSRIEDNLADLMEIYLPPGQTGDIATMVTVGKEEDKRVSHYGHIGRSGDVEADIEDVLTGRKKPQDVFVSLDDVLSRPRSGVERIIGAKRNADGSIEMREAGIRRDKPRPDGTPGRVNVEQSKKTGRDAVNGKTGVKIDCRKRTGRTQEERTDAHVRNLFDRLDADKMGICVNLLSKSGLGRNRAERDVNILEDSIGEAKRHLHQDDLGPTLDRHFGLDALPEETRTGHADGCTIASLLLMNAALLHQRIAAGKWLPGITGMESAKSATDAVRELQSQWNRVARHDFLPVMEPAIEIIDEVEKSGRREGLNRALRHLAAEAERIAEDYADLGSDHAGPLFNKVMGNQASDGAFFTRPPAAALLARLTLNVAGGGGTVGLTGKHGSRIAAWTWHAVRGRCLPRYSPT